MKLDSLQHQAFLRDIQMFVDAERIYTDELRTLAWGTDAGFYRLIPKIVVRASNEAEVAHLLRAASRHGVAVTFRAAGTSLSGQAITDSVLIVAGKGWENYQISQDLSAITLEPGIIGSRVNEILAPYGRMFAPDPASKKSAMVGGIIINNASGMNCGTHANSDRVLHSVRIVLADGTVLDTADPVSRASFTATHKPLLDEIIAIRDEIRSDEALEKRIRHKYSIKNVTGLNILPFVLYDDPFDIIAHCMVGSEGTLAFLSRATMATSHLYPCKASAMLYFSTVTEACRCIVALKKNSPADSCELLDTKSLAAVHDSTGTDLTAVLLDTKADTPELLQQNIDAINAVISQFALFKPAHFSSDPAETDGWWALRSGVFPTVGGTRRNGTTALIEDIAFHIDELPQATEDLLQLLHDSGYG
ncbi:MAG: FAD-binding oxidoreductase, partial [Muribaculaceae bacterium]